MSDLNFDQYTLDAINGFPEKLKSLDLNVKVSEMINYVVAGIQATTAMGQYEDILFAANFPGTIGNDITLVFDGILTIGAVASAWNILNPTNTVSYTGLSSEVPTAGYVILSGGKDYKFTPSSGSPAAQFEDVRYKYRQASAVRQRVITEIINELGFGYISDLMETTKNPQSNTLLVFTSLINSLKGSRQGLELILQLLGIGVIVTEWWQNIITITCSGDTAGSLNSKYFFLTSSNNNYYVWLNNGTGVDPMISGYTGIEVPYSNNDNDIGIADAIYNVLKDVIIDLAPGFNITPLSNVLNITPAIFGMIATPGNSGFSMEINPAGPVDTWVMQLDLSTFSSLNFADTVDKLRAFAVNYVYPLLTDIFYVYYAIAAAPVVLVAGSVRRDYTLSISHNPYAGTV